MADSMGQQKQDCVISMTAVFSPLSCLFVTCFSFELILLVHQAPVAPIGKGGNVNFVCICPSIESLHYSLVCHSISVP